MVAKINATYLITMPLHRHGDIATLVQAIGLYGNALFSLSNAQMSDYSALASLDRYSAIWPPGTDVLVKRRSLQLR